MSVKRSRKAPAVRLSTAVGIVRRALIGKINALDRQINALEKRKAELAERYMALDDLCGIDEQSDKKSAAKRKSPPRRIASGSGHRFIRKNGKMSWPECAYRMLKKGERVGSDELYKRILDANLHEPGDRGVQSMRASISGCRIIKYDKRAKGWYLGHNS